MNQKLFVILFITGIILISGCVDEAQQQTVKTTNEKQEATAEEPSVKQPTTGDIKKDTYNDCKKRVLKEECEKYNLLYTEYSTVVGFITCTDDGAYTVDDIGDSSKYLQVYAPERSIQIACNAYTKLTGKDGCIEDSLSRLCEKEGLVYTDYSTAVGFATCTDDGFYTSEEIGNNAKYKQVYITQEALDTKCE